MNPRFLLLSTAHPPLAGDGPSKQDGTLSQAGAGRAARRPETSLCVRGSEAAGGGGGSQPGHTARLPVAWRESRPAPQGGPSGTPGSLPCRPTGGSGQVTPLGQSRFPCTEMRVTDVPACGHLCYSSVLLGDTCRCAVNLEAPALGEGTRPPSKGVDWAEPSDRAGGRGSPQLRLPCALRTRPTSTSGGGRSLVSRGHGPGCSQKTEGAWSRPEALGNRGQYRGMRPAPEEGRREGGREKEGVGWWVGGWVGPSAGNLEGEELAAWSA